MGYYSFSNYKLMPRDSNDVIGHVIGIESDINNMPTNFELHQNYPNPFNPTTNIVFDAAGAAHMQVNIYNVLGQKIKTLFSGNVLPGIYTLQWDGTNESGRLMSSGIYFYQLKGNNVSITKKMFLMK